MGNLERDVERVDGGGEERGGELSGKSNGKVV
jgi:hypothetical protein